MKASELMIDDWVICTLGNTYEQVVELYETQAMLFYNDLYDYDEIEPIPLTPELLEKIGFTKAEQKDDCQELFWWPKPHSIYGNSINVKFYKEELDGSSIVFRCEHTRRSGQNSFHSCDVRYLHEMQHALKDCKIEFKIDLIDYDKRRSH